MIMEVYCFFIFGGLFLAVIFIFVGIVIGGCIDKFDRKKSGNKGTDKNTSEGIRDGFDYSNVHNSRTNYCSNSFVGNVRREVDNRQDLGFVPSAEQIVIVLNSLPYTARLSSYETDCVERAAHIVEVVSGFIQDKE